MKKIIRITKKLTKSFKAKKMACLKVVAEKIDKWKTKNKKYFHFGKMSTYQALIVILFFAIIFMSQVILIHRYYYKQLLEKIPQPITLEDARREYLENKIGNLVKGTPMEVMVPFIAEKNKKTAAFLIGIARKESNWGKRKPVLDGKDCFNYWGYRLKTEKMGSGGHTCFSSPEEAVNVVGRRIEEIIKKNEVDSAKKMIVWKCGYSCATHSPESVSKWIRDVDMYSQKILN